MKGEVKLHGFVSRPEIQKLNRNSIFIFVNGRLIRDRLVQHALTEAYRNIIPPTVYPVVLLFLEMPFTEVDVNVHPSKTEVRFRQSSVLHDFIRDSVRAVLMKARPVPAFMTEMHAQPTASPSSRHRARAIGRRRRACRSRKPMRRSHCVRRSCRRSPRVCNLKAAAFAVAGQCGDSGRALRRRRRLAAQRSRSCGGDRAGSEWLLAIAAGRRCACRTGIAGHR